jgi:hypothetical protein
MSSHLVNIFFCHSKSSSKRCRIGVSYSGKEAILNCTVEKVVAQELMKLKRISSAKKDETEKRVSTLMAEVKKKFENS